MKMINKFLESLEDPERPLLGKNYYIFEKLGLLLPENKPKRILYIVVHEIITYYVVTQYMELPAIKSDMDLTLTNLKISMLSTIVVCKSNSFLLWHTKWRQVMDYVTEADKYERDNANAARRKIIDNYTKYCRRVAYFYWVLAFATVLLLLCVPLITFLSSPPSYREELRNGTRPFPHIFTAWTPYDKYHYIARWITVLLQISVCSFGGCIMAGYDTNVIAILVFFEGKLDLLRERCKNMLGSAGKGVSDEEAEKAIRELHKVHLLLTKYSRLFNSVLSPVMFLYGVVCSLMLCASVFQLASATSTPQKLLNAEYLIFGIAQLFMFCWHGNNVIVKSGDLIYGPYESEWWAANAYQRKNILILSGQFRLKHVFKAGPFTDLTLYTFITILKGAYSYYTLLRK